MSEIGIFYGSTRGNTEDLARRIQKEIGRQRADLYNVSKVSPEKLTQYKYLLIGSSTWGIGEAQDDMTEFLPAIVNCNLAGCKVAVFGTANQSDYPDSFADGLGVVVNALKKSGAEVIGEMPASDFKFKKSMACENGSMIGLVVDDDESSKKGEARLKAWVGKLNECFV